MRKQVRGVAACSAQQATAAAAAASAPLPTCMLPRPLVMLGGRCCWRCCCTLSWPRCAWVARCVAAAASALSLRFAVTSAAAGQQGSEKRSKRDGGRPVGQHSRQAAPSSPCFCSTATAHKRPIEALHHPPRITFIRSSSCSTCVAFSSRSAAVCAAAGEGVTTRRLVLCPAPTARRHPPEACLHRRRCSCSAAPPPSAPESPAARG